MRKRILIAGDHNRNDFLFIARLLKGDADFFFIEYLNDKDIKNRDCLALGKVLFWKDYSDAYDLLDSVKPDKVLFYFIETFNHVALNVACKVKGVSTHHLEHGVRFPLSYYKAINASQAIVKKPSLINRIKVYADLYDKYLNRQFFINTKNKSPKEESSFLSQYYKVRRSNEVFETFEKIKSPLRLPDSYISFGPLIFAFHKQLENLPDNYPVQYIGIPQFDDFYKFQNVEKYNCHVLFIDQPLHEQGLYGWTEIEKENFLSQLLKVVVKQHRKLFVKPHPWNDSRVYNELKSSPHVQFVSDNWDDIIPEISIVLGFSSTLLLPFMALKHTTCFAMEVHPTKLQIPYSQFMIESGACDAIINLEELERILKDLSAYKNKQSNTKEQFIKRYMFKFDGLSGERLKKIVLGEVS